MAEIIAAAGVSRATFYFYFSSKYAVLTGLLEQVMEEIFSVVQPFVRPTAAAVPEQALRQSLSAAIELWGSHRPAMRAVHEHWNSTDELRTLWTRVVERFTDAVSSEIDRQRAVGLVPLSVDSRTLAATLLWGTEQVLYVSGLGIERSLPQERDTLAPLMVLWTGALYSGSPVAASQA